MAVCVTGGTSGVGFGIAKRLAKPGERIYLTYHSNEEAAAQAAAFFEEMGAIPIAFKLDFALLDDVANLGEKIRSYSEPVDVLVHAAAAAFPGKLIGMDADQIERAVRINGSSFMHVVRELHPKMRRGTSVVYVTSKGSERALDNYGGIGAPKAMSDHLVRYLARELAPEGIRVNCISPGPVDTLTRRNMFPDTWEERLRLQKEANPSGRNVELEEVAEVVFALCSPGFAMVQGQTITIDGGLTL